jgi:hypothetical protein
MASLFTAFAESAGVDEKLIAFAREFAEWKAIDEEEVWVMGLKKFFAK